ncbi:MAG: hypothetical protein RLZZ290_106 [Pseudomonadota bacterium]|jgi:hypothetical protein
MERAFARTLPYLRDAPSGQVRVVVQENRQKPNLRLALVLFSVAAVFFGGVILKYVLFPVA